AGPVPPELVLERLDEYTRRGAHARGHQQRQERNGGDHPGVVEAHAFRAGSAFSRSGREPVVRTQSAGISVPAPFQKCHTQLYLSGATWRKLRSGKSSEKRSNRRGRSCACPVGVPPALECASKGRHKTCPYEYFLTLLLNACPITKNCVTTINRLQLPKT